MRRDLDAQTFRRLYYVTEALKAREARGDVAKYLEYSLLDDHGGRINLSAVHYAMIAHWEYCKSHHYHGMFRVLWNHGKTTLAAGLIGHVIGSDPERRIKYVGSTDREASKRLVATAKLLQSSRYRAVFPHIRPAPDRKWNDRQIFVERKAVFDPNPTIESYGVLNAASGNRADDVICDDCVDRSNAIDSPAERVKVTASVEGVWMSRLDPKHGIMFWLNVPWIKGDATSHFYAEARRGQSKWCCLSIRVADNMRGLEVEIVGGDDDYQECTGIRTGMMLKFWSERFTREFFEDWKRNRSAEYARGFALIEVDPKNLMFPSFGQCWQEFDPANVVQGHWPKVFGIDLAGEGKPGNVVFAGTLSPANERYPLAVEAVEGKLPAFFRRVTELDAQYNPLIIVVENNGIQQGVIDMCQDNPEKYPWWYKVKPYTTTAKTKRDLEIGMPGMELEFHNKAWKISKKLNEGHDVNCQCGACRWKTAMGLWPMTSDSDTVMAGVFFWEGCRQLSVASTIAASGDEIDSMIDR